MRLALGLGLPYGAAAGEAAFDPLSLSPHAFYLPEPQYLFQEEDGTGAVSADGTAVGYVADLSGNGNHLIQATAAARPLYKTAGGLHWLEFDGVDDVLALAAGVGNIDAFTLAWGQRETNRQNGTTWDITSLTTNRMRAHAPFGDGNFYVDVFNDASGRCTGAWPYAVGDDVVASLSRSGADIVLRTEGASLDTASNSDQMDGNGINIGSSAGGPYAGRLTGFVLIKSAISANDLALLETYLAAKQGRVL